MSTPIFGAGLWNFASYVDRYATDGYAEPVSTLEQIRIAGSVGDLSYVDLNFPYSHDATLDEIKEALAAADLKAIGITPDIYLRRFGRGAFTNPDPAIRVQAIDLMHKAAEDVRALGAKYVKLWPGQDGWDYPFQVHHGDIWKLAKDGLKELASAHPDLKFVI